MDAMYEVLDCFSSHNIIDVAVVVEDAVGHDRQVCGAKLLYGKGALKQYLSQEKVLKRSASRILLLLHSLQQLLAGNKMRSLKL